MYLFTSPRLGFRRWKDSDLDWYAEMNADSQVMQHFPKVMTREESAASIQKLQSRYTQYGHTYYVAELLETKDPIGFIGLGYQDFESEVTPLADIGWRLLPRYWGQGYATEGAKACLRFAFAPEHLDLDDIYAIAPESNLPSIAVMQRIGMQYQQTFDHPLLVDYPRLQSCVLYHISRSSY